MLIDLTHDDLDTVVSHGSVIEITGTSSDDPTLRVAFAGDHRSMAGIIAILEDGMEIPALVEDWQVLSTRAREAV